jgi:hypothetical protein
VELWFSMEVQVKQYLDAVDARARLFLRSFCSTSRLFVTLVSTLQSLASVVITTTKTCSLPRRPGQA